MTNREVSSMLKIVLALFVIAMIIIGCASSQMAYEEPAGVP